MKNKLKIYTPSRTLTNKENVQRRKSISMGIYIKNHPFCIEERARKVFGETDG